MGNNSLRQVSEHFAWNVHTDFSPMKQEEEKKKDMIRTSARPFFLLFLHLKVDADLEKFFRGKIHDGNAGAFFNAPDGGAHIIP